MSETIKAKGESQMQEQMNNANNKALSVLELSRSMADRLNDYLTTIGPTTEEKVPEAEIVSAAHRVRSISYTLKEAEDILNDIMNRLEA